MGSLSWYGAETVAVVTGGNKGIGLEIVRGFAEHGITTVLTARDEQRGRAAVQQLHNEGLRLVAFHPLEVTQSASVKTLGEWLRSTYGGFDILVNNAGVLHKHCDFPTAQQTIQINYWGTKIVTAGLLPFARPSGYGVRVVNVASELGQLSQLSQNPKLRRRFAEATSVDEVDALAEQFLNDVKNGRLKEKGWPTAYHSYTVSKMAQLAYTRILARQLEKPLDDKRIFVNAMTPGYCATDMTRYMGYRTPTQGADTAVWLAVLPREELPHGRFFSDRHEIHY